LGLDEVYYILAKSTSSSFSAITFGESHLLVTKSTIPSVSFSVFGYNVCMLADKGNFMKQSTHRKPVSKSTNGCRFKTRRNNFPSWMREYLNGAALQKTLDLRGNK
jgi:hypothetical protein